MLCVVVAVMMATACTASEEEVASTSEALAVRTSRATWELDPSFGWPQESTTELHLLVTEVDCANGIAPGDALQAPTIEVRDDRIEIRFTIIREVPRDVTTTVLCPGNPSTPVIVELGRALGDSALFDTGADPAERRW